MLNLWNVLWIVWNLHCHSGFLQIGVTNVTYVLMVDIRTHHKVQLSTVCPVDGTLLNVTSVWLRSIQSTLASSSPITQTSSQQTSIWGCRKLADTHADSTDVCDESSLLTCLYISTEQFRWVQLFCSFSYSSLNPERSYCRQGTRISVLVVKGIKCSDRPRAFTTGLLPDVNPHVCRKCNAPLSNIAPSDSLSN